MMEGATSVELKDQETVRVQSLSPYEELDDNTQKWLDEIKQIWRLSKKTAGLRSQIWDFFENAQDPYKSALQIMINSGDFHKGKQSSLAFHLMENFAKWTRVQSPIPISKDLKLDALNLIIRQKNSAFIVLVMVAFKMKEDKEIFIASIRRICTSGNHKEACHIATFLGLHEHFTVEDFVVPLVFEDKYPIAEKFLQKSERHQLELTKYLDNLTAKKDLPNEINSIIERLNIREPKMTSLSYKPLNRLLAKIIRSYSLPSAACPNLNEKRGKEGLCFFLHKKYIQKSISGEIWENMIFEVVGDDANLQAELLRGLIAYKDFKEALYWARTFEIRKGIWPKKLLKFQQGEKLKSSSEKPWENWDLEDTPPRLKFHTFPLSEYQIRLIDTASEFLRFIYDLRRLSVIGIDAHWKRSPVLKSCDVTILQVAANDVVYIIDVMTLLSAAPQHLWEKFANTFFGRSEILKLGFGISLDIFFIQQTLWNHMRIETPDLEILDLAALSAALVQKYNFTFPFSTSESSSKKSESLSSLIELCFGERLDTSDEFCDWDTRPLSKNQILYAALEAYCLLEAYDVITTESKKQKIPINELVAGIICGTDI